MAAIQVASESGIHDRSILHNLGNGFVGVTKAVWLSFSTTLRASADAEELRRYRRAEFGEDTFTYWERYRRNEFGEVAFTKWETLTLPPPGW